MLNTKRLALCRLLLCLMPETRLFPLKARLLGWAGAILGESVRVCSSVTILGNGRISIGTGAWIGHGALIISGSEVVIGANVDIAPRVLITTGTHEIDEAGPRAAGVGVHKSVAIGDGAWIGAGAIILPGVRIAQKTIVAAGAVVTKSTNAGQVVAGNPARPVERGKHHAVSSK